MIDNNILDFIQANMRCLFLDRIMPYISLIGNEGAVWILLALILLIIPSCRKTGIEMSIALILSLLIGNIALKPLIARARPFTANPDFILLIRPPTDYSFPSGHTMSSFAAATVIWFANKKYGTAALALAALIAFSRLYLYVHYLTDVLAGLVIGVLIAILSAGVIKEYRKT